MARQGWQNDHQSGGGLGRFLLLLLLMALAAAGGWVVGDDELLGRVGAWGENPSASVAPVAPVQPEPVPTKPPSNARAVAAPTPTPSLPAMRVLTVTPRPTPVPPTAPPPLPPPPLPPPPPPPPPPTPTYIPPHLRHLEYKQYMLELINLERARAGVGPVTLGTNNAAQLHAESSLKNCVSSHWGVDGLKPYMRYSLAGGHQSNGENGSGLDYCYGIGDRVRGIGSLRNEVRETMDGWMDSPGHRRNILKPTHRKVNIGLAWDTYNQTAVQHFEGDYVEYSALPTLSNGQLAFKGELKNGAIAREEDDLGVQIYYDPPPHSLTRGQLSRTYCYDGGLKVASLRPPLQPNWSYPTNQFAQTTDPCADPYDVPSDAPAPRSGDEAHRHWQEAYNVSQSRPSVTRTIPWITAKTLSVRGDSFDVVADLNNIIGQYGPGVYTVMVWARLMGDDNVVSQYSIFHGITSPDGYSG